MYRVELSAFEGPLDLLLYFIKRDELDIYDIPIAKIADEYLSYVRLMEEVDLDGVGDFIFMAALLINIKARMLLPRQETDEEGEPIDPRRELVERLLEYIRYRDAAEELEVLSARRDDRFVRGEASAAEDFEVEGEPHPVTNGSVFHLISALHSLLTEAPEEEEPVHAVERKEYSVEEQWEYVLGRLDGIPKVRFRALAQRKPKGRIIATFLAVLEMARQGVVSLAITEAADDFYVARGADMQATGTARAA